jgi:hypothetical protein
MCECTSRARDIGSLLAAGMRERVAKAGTRSNVPPPGIT